MSAPCPAGRPTRRTIELRQRYRFSVNEASTWRDRMGNLLRRVATRIDGRHSIAVAIHSDPPLSPAQHQQCLQQAAVAIDRAVEIECRHELTEIAMRELCPQLFADRQASPNTKEQRG